MELDEALELIPAEKRAELFEFLQMTGQERRSVRTVREALDLSFAMKSALAADTQN